MYDFNTGRYREATLRDTAKLQILKLDEDKRYKSLLNRAYTY